MKERKLNADAAAGLRPISFTPRDISIFRRNGRLAAFDPESEESSVVRASLETIRSNSGG